LRRRRKPPRVPHDHIHTLEPTTACLSYGSNRALTGTPAGTIRLHPLVQVGIERRQPLQLASVLHRGQRRQVIVGVDTIGAIARPFVSKIERIELAARSPCWACLIV
jgi:hypothetical protein